MSFILRKTACNNVQDLPWERVKPLTLLPVGGEARYQSLVQAAYSDSGLFFRFSCDDERLDCPALPDGGDLYTGDVVELFIKPCAEQPVYLELELSPLNKELVLLVCNCKTSYFGWQPWHYEDGRRTQHRVSVLGQQEPGGICSRWTAELFVPFALFEGVIPAAPKAGDCWQINAFRIDYGASETRWALDTGCGTEFHDVWLHPHWMFSEEKG